MTGDLNPGSPGLWRLGETFGLLPSTVHPGTLVGDLVAGWRAEPHRHGCPHAATTTPAFVFAPDRAAWCVVCADMLRRAGKPNHCIACGTELDPSPKTAPGLVIVEDHGVRFVFVLCHPCSANNPEVF